MQQKWYEGATRGQWLALTAALLGWMFDGFEMGIFPLVARPALVEVLDLGEDARKAAPTSEALLSAREKQDVKEAKQRVDGQVGLWMGLVTAAFLVGAALGGWFFGWLGDRVGRVRAMIFSVLTYALFTGLCGLAQDAYQLALLRFTAALGMGGEWSLGVALVMESWPARARPVLAGLIGAAANVGFILTVVLVMAVEGAGVSLSDGGWRWVLGACAFPALLTFLLRMFVPESEKWLHAVQTGPKAGLADIFTPQLRYRTIMAAVLGGIALIGTWGSVQWIPVWVRAETGDQQMVNLAQMSSGLGAVVGTLAAAMIGHYVARRLMYFLLCFASLAISMFLFLGPFYPKEGGASFFATVFVTGLLTASFYGWLPLYLPELFPTRVRATGQGFGFNFGRIIAAGGAVSAGVLVHQVFGGNFALAGATITLIYIVGMLVVWVAPETRGQPLPE
ncbi:MAG: MFS transporter [Gemmataceae bacterium]|nr:MFS transporter [Gemmataceae bacterium]